ncbi:MAG: hypothetical protein QW035_03150 [Candidatus Anstonellales archaeon]
MKVKRCWKKIGKNENDTEIILKHIYKKLEVLERKEEELRYMMEKLITGFNELKNQKRLKREEVVERVVRAVKGGKEDEEEFGKLKRMNEEKVRLMSRDEMKDVAEEFIGSVDNSGDLEEATNFIALGIDINTRDNSTILL